MNELERRKHKLKSLESRLRSTIDSDSDRVEDQLKTYAATGAIVGLTLVGGYKLYRLISPKSKSKKNKGGKNTLKSAGPFSNAKQRVFAIAATLLYNEFKKAISEGQQKVEETLKDKPN